MKTTGNFQQNVVLINSMMNCVGNRGIKLLKEFLITEKSLEIAVFLQFTDAVILGKLQGEFMADDFKKCLVKFVVQFLESFFFAKFNAKSSGSLL